MSRLKTLISNIKDKDLHKVEYGDLKGYWCGSFTRDEKDFHFIMNNTSIIGMWYMPKENYKTYGFITNPKICNKPLSFTENVSEEHIVTILERAAF